MAKPALIFDLFHTLTAPESAWARCPMTFEVLGLSAEKWNEQLLEKSRPRLAGEINDPLAIVRTLAHAIDPHLPLALIERATASRLERFRSSLMCISDSTIQTLKTLKARGKKIGLLSNADAGEIASWPDSPLAPLFDSTVFSCQVGFVKPERAIYEVSLRQLAVAPADCIFIGDGGSNELDGAQSLGMTTVFIAGIIRELWPDKIVSRKKMADFTIENLTELLA